MAEEKKEAQAENKKKLDTGLILQVVFAVLNLAVVGGGAFMVYSSTLGWESPKITEQQLEDAKDDVDDSKLTDASPLIYTMDKLTVNLLGDPKRLVRVEVNLEMLGKEGFEEIIDIDNRARARDKIISILNKKEFSEVESLQGKLFLKDQITNELNTMLVEGVVKDVYFTEFVVQ
jgi:flagellar protein FliL